MSSLNSEQIKDYNDNGFVFFTNLESRKSKDIKVAKPGGCSQLAEIVQ